MYNEKHNTSLTRLVFWLNDTDGRQQKQAVLCDVCVLGWGRGDWWEQSLPQQVGAEVDCNMCWHAIIFFTLLFVRIDDFLAKAPTSRLLLPVWGDNLEPSFLSVNQGSLWSHYSPLMTDLHNQQIFTINEPINDLSSPASIKLPSVIKGQLYSTWQRSLIQSRHCYLSVTWFTD